MVRKRLDILLVERGFFPSRMMARSAVMAGHVFVSGQRVDKVGTLIDPEAGIEVRGGQLPYVSRGGLKLEKALRAFDIDLTDRTVLDVGASTGGFTDCALQFGARRVYAVDVGYGQLAWKLRQDPRVVVYERTNIRHLEQEKLDPGAKPDFATVDVSFISLSKILPQIDRLTADDADAVLLIKPQFEAGPDRVGKKGVVRDPVVHAEVIRSVIDAVHALGWTVKGLTWSPVRGPEGNIEYLLYAGKKGGRRWDGEVADVVEEAHRELKDKGGT
ncbi:TlyA family RNA methyltransferase [Desulforudis sp. 1088]|uniref:TlyA family RNA methyltransferase n=1 Tax=unclassified Candidatus Desulforudis TaxID=2635950 RepID=UPI003CE5B151